MCANTELSGSLQCLQILDQVGHFHLNSYINFYFDKLMKKVLMKKILGRTLNQGRS